MHFVEKLYNPKKKKIQKEKNKGGRETIGREGGRERRKKGKEGRKGRRKYR